MAGYPRIRVATLISSPVRAVRHMAAWFRWHTSGVALVSGQAESGEAAKEQKKAA